MSEIKPVGHLVTGFGGDVCLVTNEKKIQILAEMGWPIVTVYGESALAKARAEERERLENEIVLLRAYVERGVALLHPLAGNEEVDGYRARAIRALDERTEK